MPELSVCLCILTHHWVTKSPQFTAVIRILLPHLADFFRGMDQEKLGIQYVDTPEQSKKLNSLSHALIMAGSGMCTGGRILHHLKHGYGTQRTI